ncbi:uncharacterized protein DSM5745_10656 [Aspergillus mulundensis]|uniref:Uncharacterized protein n=1 Tax=Aspergillus mulundensis TaxID=1810919 RepID=A0A3D8QHI2_9EURO|nr:hypothetical protein DSM5745_10656 [Aspergillus mulundensis]RDW61158.1 hypothetical protein DSM5745_10656 [Aspergillus mulundensis]
MVSGKQHRKPTRRKPPVLTWRVGTAPSKQSKIPKARDGDHNEVQQETANFQRDPRSATHDAELALQRLLHPGIREIATSLDPFCELPCHLTPEDRSLLHCCESQGASGGTSDVLTATDLLQVPARVYGTRTDTVFSAVRDVSFPISLGSSLTMWWMLIAADGIFANNGDNNQVAWRKRQAYRLLNGQIQDGRGRVDDPTLGGIIMAAITEARLSAATACHAHLNGYEAAVRARGGLRASLITSILPALRMAHIMPYLVCDPSPNGGSSDAQQIQEFMSFIATKMRHRGFSPFSDVVLAEVDLFRLNLMVPGLLVRKFGSYLSPNERELARFMDEAASFLALFLIVLTLWRTSESIYNAQLFVSRMAVIFDASTAFDPHTGHPLLTQQGFLWIVIKAVTDLLEMLYGLNVENEIWPIMQAVEALKAFRSMTSHGARLQARLLLFSLLSGQNDMMLDPGQDEP